MDSRFGQSFGRRRFLIGASAATAATTLHSLLPGNLASATPVNPSEVAPGSNTGSSHPARIALSVGRGIADMTGEPLGAGMNGYAVLSQTSSGLRQRQFARAFIFTAGDTGSSTQPSPNQRVVHVTADMGLMFQSIQQEVLRRLSARFGGLYHEGNVLIGASHTHVAPGGTSGHLMVDLTTLGFRPITFEATVAGIVTAIERAHDDIQPSELELHRAEVTDAGVNRSFQSFKNNDEKYQRLFPNGVDPQAATLHVIRGGKSVGFINWYGIHPTTFGPEHTIISGDSKGYAAWLAEHSAGVDHSNLAHAPFVAAFAMATPGDVSPNHGLVPNSGPVPGNEYESARVLGRRQLAAITGAVIPLSGNSIASRWKWHDMANFRVSEQFHPDGHSDGRTGPAILGAAFAASSQEDGGGEPLLGFNEGERGGTGWVAAVNKVVVPSEAKQIHGNKELLLPVGYIPGLLQQTHLFHIHQIGTLVLVSLAFEPTTVAGYQIRELVAEHLGIHIDQVIVQGYTSGYGHYVTTPEEYDGQDYEGGATAFGRLLLPAMKQIFAELADALISDSALDPGQAAGDLTGKIPPSPAGAAIADLAPLGTNFGDVKEAPETITAGQTARVVFVGVNPNSDLRHEQGFFDIRATNSNITPPATGIKISDDSHENSVIDFKKDGAYVDTIITWDTTGIAAGSYTLTYRGSAKHIDGTLSPFEGTAQITVVG